jgi:hypothetical protein
LTDTFVKYALTLSPKCPLRSWLEPGRGQPESTSK